MTQNHLDCCLRSRLMDERHLDSGFFGDVFLYLFKLFLKFLKLETLLEHNRLNHKFLLINMQNKSIIHSPSFKF